MAKFKMAEQAAQRLWEETARVERRHERPDGPTVEELCCVFAIIAP